MKKFLIAGNWKMNTSLDEAINLSKSLVEFSKTNENINEILVCPPFIWINKIKEICTNSKVKVGAQNCYYKPNGAFTGEISIEMLDNIKVDYVILGHSERRQIFKETDELINLKLQNVINSSIKPILCIGETLEERQANKAFEVVENQITKAFQNIETNKLNKVVIAYEPVWAIGTGVSATSEQAQEIHNHIRNFIVNKYDKSLSNIKILYGGSLNDKNADELLNMQDIDGGLIGGASLKAESFINIINFANKISKS